MPDMMEKISSAESLHDAWKTVRRKDSAGGIDSVNPGDMEATIDRVIAKLSNDLKNGSYIPMPYAQGAMPKFNAAREWRKLSMPAVIDKIVQQSFANVIGPVFEADFLDTSYAYRKNKGSIKAIGRVEHMIKQEKAAWAAVADIDNFFDNINHDILIKGIELKISEQAVVNLVKLWLNAGIISHKGEWDSPDEGIAQGSVISPLLSNVYLHPLDELAYKRKYQYLRYSDNLILVSQDRDKLHDSYREVREFLESTLKLKFNADPYPFKSLSSGFVFLGIYFRGDVRRISRAKENRMLGQISWITDIARRIKPDEYIESINESTKGAKRYYGFIQPTEQLMVFDEFLSKRLKGLLGNFKFRGMITKRADIESWVKRIEFFGEYDESARKTLIGEITDGAMAPYTHGKNENAGTSSATPKTFKRMEPASATFKSVPQTKTLASSDARLPEAKVPVADKTAVAETQPAPDSSGRAGIPPASARGLRLKQSQLLRHIADKAELMVSTPSSFIGKTGGRIVVRCDRKTVAEIQSSKLKSISISSHGISISSDVILLCSHSSIPVTYFGPRGAPYATLQSPMHSMGGISVCQIRAYETEKALDLVKKTITGKSKNQVNLLKYYMRSRKKTENEFRKAAIENIPKMEKKISEMNEFKFETPYSIIRDRLFAAEGYISSLYWDCVKIIVPQELGFTARNRYKARDVVNCMLNYGYGIMYQRVWRAVMKSGLDPGISFLHAFQANKPTLVYDLVEEYRQPFVDRAVIGITIKCRKADLNVDTESGLLSNITKEKVAKAVLSVLNGLMTYRGKKVKAEDIIDFQVKDFVKAVKDENIYRPFIFEY